MGINKLLALSSIIFPLTGHLEAQDKVLQYQSVDWNIVLNAGDTIQFLEGSLGGQFVHVFYMVGKIQKRRATFSSGFYSELVIDHFRVRKESREEITYAVLGIPNKPKWFVWVELDEALIKNEVSVKTEK